MSINAHTMERFVSIKGYEGLYNISNKGNIFSIKRDRLLKPSLRSGGRYKVIVLRKDNKMKNFTLHRLVFFTFNPDENENDKVVDHIDGDTFNNDLINLQLISQNRNISRGKLTNTGEHNIWDIGKKKNGDSRYRVVIKSNKKQYGKVYYNLDEAITERDKILKKLNL